MYNQTHFDAYSHVCLYYIQKNNRYQADALLQISVTRETNGKYIVFEEKILQRLQFGIFITAFIALKSKLSTNRKLSSNSGGFSFFTFATRGVADTKSICITIVLKMHKYKNVTK